MKRKLKGTRYDLRATKANARHNRPKRYAIMYREIERAKKRHNFNELLQGHTPGGWKEIAKWLGVSVPTLLQAISGEYHHGKAVGPAMRAIASSVARHFRVPKEKWFK